MDRRSSDNFRIALFIFGAVIIILASILVPLRMLLLTTRIFVWIAVFVMYLVIATPFIAPLLHSDKLDALFTGGIIYARGACVYLILSILILFAAITGTFRIGILYLFQLTALFVLILYLYLSLGAASFTSGVQKYEKDKSADLDKVKSEAKMLSTSLSGMDPDICTKMGKIAEDIRYISPSDDGRARNLEVQMLDLLDEMNDRRNMEPFDKAAFRKYLDQLQALTAQRKKYYSE